MPFLTLSMLNLLSNLSISIDNLEIKFNGLAN